MALFGERMTFVFVAIFLLTSISWAEISEASIQQNQINVDSMIISGSKNNLKVQAVIRYELPSGSTCSIEPVKEKIKEKIKDIGTDAIEVEYEHPLFSSSCNSVIVVYYRRKSLSRGIGESPDGNFSVGYQIAGNSMIGIDYEFRAHERIGLHAGIGYKGAGGGIRIHFNDKVNGTYFDVRYLDGGFGLIESAAAEVGSTFGNDDGLGLRTSIGLQTIFYMNPKFREYMFGKNDDTFLVAALSIGVAF